MDSLKDVEVVRGRVAAFDRPLIGPYDSGDRRVIRYHLELLRLSGVRGIIVNWYGTRKHFDFPENLAASDAIIEEAERAGLLFTVCYEDWTVVSPVRWEQRPEGELLRRARRQLAEDFRYIRDRYMGRRGFLRQPGSNGTVGRPVVLVFGPRVLLGPSDWEGMQESVFPEEAERPALVTLSKSIAGGSFAWFPKLLPQMETSLDDVYRYLTDFYDELRKREFRRPGFGSIFAGFRDFYSEGSAGRIDRIGRLRDFDGLAQDVTLQLARLHRPDFLQIATWNDWQEGTAFEPSQERGFERLLRVQEFLLGHRDEAALRRALAAYREEVGAGPPRQLRGGARSEPTTLV